MCFFHDSLQPLPRLHRCKRPKLLTQCECTVTSNWLVIFCTTNSSLVLARERWQTFEISLKKTQYLMNTLYIYCDFGNRNGGRNRDSLPEIYFFNRSSLSTGLFLSFFLFHIIILFDLFRSIIKSIGVFFTANQKWQ